jgi:hypothetical protein
LGLLAVCAAYAALVLHHTPWAEARQLDAIFPFYKWRTRVFSAGELAAAWRLLAGSAAVFGTGALLLAAGAAGRAERRACWRELRTTASSLRRAVAQLPAHHKWGAAAALLALTVFRVVLSLPAVTPEYDDAASYTLFVSKGLLAVSAYYPLPNNHVLSNTISQLFYNVYPGFWWTMRLPVVLQAAVATAVLFVGLLRERVAFRPALLATGLFSLAQLSLYHVAVGRGYWLLTALAGVAFFSTLPLARGTTQPRAAWSLLVVSGVLGAYSVPTFALVLASSFTWLGWAFLRRKAAGAVAKTAAAGVIIAAASLLLYTPLMFVSGPGMLFGNGFVAPHPLAEFLAGWPRYLWESEGFLAGQVRVGALVTLAGLVGVFCMWRAARGGRLPPQVASAWQRLAPAALWFMAVPYAVLTVQRAFAPGRTLLYKAFFFFLLLALVIEWLLLLKRRPFRAFQPWLRSALGVTAVVWFGYQLVSLWRDNLAPRRNNAAYHAAFAWLASQPRGLVLVPEPTHSIFLRLYFLSERPAATWRLDGRPKPYTHYPYVVAFPERRGYFQPKLAGPPAFHNQEVDIYRVPDPGATKRPIEPAYWYLND